MTGNYDVMGAASGLVDILVCLLWFCIVNPLRCKAQDHNKNFDCNTHICSANSSSALICPPDKDNQQSLILLHDVTSLAGNVSVNVNKYKKQCMGRTHCQPCQTGDSLVLHYYCVKKHPSKDLFQSCDQRENIYIDIDVKTHSQGYLQNPGYPENVTRGQIPCKWRFTKLRRDMRIVLILHHLETKICEYNRLFDPCEWEAGGLNVTGSACDTERHQYAPKYLHSSKAGMTSEIMERCGDVTVELSNAYPEENYPIRYWMSFQVLPVQSSGRVWIRAPARPPHSGGNAVCRGWRYTERHRGNGTKAVLKPTPGTETSTSEDDLQLLVVTLSVTGGACVLLLVLLIVVCVRCRAQSSVYTEHIYSEPSSPGVSLTAHLQRVEDADKPRLADDYFDVADALPARLQAPPTSPVYTEVEALRAEKNSLPRNVEVIEVETNKKPRKTKGVKHKNSYNNVPAAESKADEVEKRPRRSVLERLKGDRNRHSDRDKPPTSSTPGSPKASSPKTSFLSRMSSKYGSARASSEKSEKKPRLELVTSSHVLTSADDVTIIRPSAALVAASEEVAQMYEPVDGDEYEPIAVKRDSLQPIRPEINSESPLLPSEAAGVEASIKLNERLSKDHLGTKSKTAKAKSAYFEAAATMRTNGYFPTEPRSTVAILCQNKHSNGKAQYEDSFEKPLVVRLNGTDDETDASSKSNKNNNAKKYESSFILRDLPKTRGLVKSGIKKFESSEDTL